MTDHDPMQGAENSGERIKPIHEGLIRALGNAARLKEQITDIEQLRADSAAEADRLKQELQRVDQDRRQFMSRANEVVQEYRDATLDTVQRLAEVLDTQAMSVEEALQLVTETLSTLDSKVLQDVAKDTWRMKQVPAVEPIDSAALVQKAQAIRDLPEDDFIGMLTSRQLFIAQPEGEPRLRLTGSVGYPYEGTEPFPYRAKIEVGIIRNEESRPGEPEVFVGDILVGADAIVDRMLVGGRYDYVTTEGKPYPAETLLEAFRRDQEMLRDVMQHDDLRKQASAEQMRRATRSLDKSNTSFRSLIGQQAAGIYTIEKNKNAYAELLGSVYFDEKDFRKTTDLIDAIYGDGNSEARVKLAAYTQILAGRFDTDGKLADNITVTNLDMRQAMYYLTLEKTEQ